MRMIFEASKIPNHRMNSGTHVIEGMARNACRVGSTSRFISAELAGDRAEHGAGDDAEGKSRDHPRERGAGMELKFPGSGRVSAKVRTMTDGDGPTRPLPPPRRTASSHAHRDGNRQQEFQRGPQQASGSAARNARVPAPVLPRLVLDARRHRHKRHNRLAECNCCFICRRGRGGARPQSPSASVRLRHVAVVDQVIDRLLHVHAGRNDAGLLQAGLALQQAGVVPCQRGREEDGR